MTRYTLTSPAFVGGLALTYDADGYLTELTSTAELSTTQRLWLSAHFPLDTHQLGLIRQSSSTLVVTETTVVPPFAQFWEQYAYKVGNKPRVNQLYDKLSDDDKVRACGAIPAYEAYLRLHPNMEKLYPQTFLHQRRFETDWKGLVKP